MTLRNPAEAKEKLEELHRAVLDLVEGDPKRCHREGIFVTGGTCRLDWNGVREIGNLEMAFLFTKAPDEGEKEEEVNQDSPRHKNAR